MDEPRYYYQHEEGEPTCQCTFAQIWTAFPHECRHCGRLLPEPVEEYAEMNTLDPNPIHTWFGLSYASYVVVPRVVLQSCTRETQQKMIDAMEAVHAECAAHQEKEWPHGARISVRLRDAKTGLFITDDYANYERGRRRLWDPPAIPDEVPAV